MQGMTEMTLVDMCYRMTQIEKTLSCTKEFSIKFNGHVKLITSLVNSLCEEEESLMLYEQKIEKTVDHYHERFVFKKTRYGEERLFTETCPDKQDHVRDEYEGFSNKITPFNRGLNNIENKLKGKGIMGTWNGHRGRREEESRSIKGEIGSRSVEGYNNLQRNMNKLEMQSEQGVDYRKDMESLGKGKMGALVEDLRFGTVDSIEQNFGRRNSEDIAISKKLDVFMKESDFLKEMIKSGEENAKHLKDCLFKLIDAFKKNQIKSDTNNKDVKIERFEKEIITKNTEVKLIRERNRIIE